MIAADASEKPLFGNLIQLYLYDMALHFGTSVNATGHYEHDILEECWEHPYLFHLNGEIAGFALVTRHCTIRERSPCWYMAEFCVLRPYQRKGVGRAAFGSILDMHAGEWEITWFDGNVPAAGFWPATIPVSDQEIHQLTVNGMDWTSVAFTSQTT
ncbi:GNAT family N-acetyltransferase [Pelagibius sp. Alg239-R121]|uniref:GNAT family N-acetyltransferase n=1 Tax=Pelagibius sp. Alg239-R121 TaxID=2993448 RepID=UPI0024A7249C|nr:GNAT family N-acetyltransferase [Pelagibius sp. Alg239-R121]